MYKEKRIRFSPEKNEILKRERGVSFEDVILAIEAGNIYDDFPHPNQEKYANQRLLILLIRIKEYVYIVPYVENDEEIFFKTIIPSRKMNKHYNQNGGHYES